MNTSTKVSNNIIAENLSLENLPNEIWKPIKGYEGFYEISSLGRVKSFKKNKEIILTQQLHYKGYLTLKLSLKNKSKRFKVHRLVALNYIENKKNKKQVNHINCNKKDNSRTNLEWCTNSENQIHACLNGLKKIKLNRYDVLKIRKDKRSLTKISKDFNISFQTVSEVKNKKIWKHV